MARFAGLSRRGVLALPPSGLAAAWLGPAAADSRPVPPAEQVVEAGAFEWGVFE
jgi:hypothetical protein